MPKFTAPKSRKIFTIVAALAVLSLVGYGVFVAINRASIPQFDDGNEYSVIVLNKTSGGIYEWSYAIEDTTIAEVVDKKSYIDYESPEVDGGTPVEEYVIQGKKAGRTKITLRYGSFTTGETEEEQTYIIEVNEKLQSRVIEQK